MTSATNKPSPRRKERSLCIVSSMIPPTQGGLPPQVERLASYLNSCRNWNITILTQTDQANHVQNPEVKVLNKIRDWGWRSVPHIVQEVRRTGIKEVVLFWVPHAYERRGINLGVPISIGILRLFGIKTHALVYEFAVNPDSFKLWLGSKLQKFSLWLLALCSERTCIAVNTWRNWTANRLFWRKKRIRFVPLGSTIPKLTFTAEKLGLVRSGAKIPPQAKVVCYMNNFGSGRDINHVFSIWEDVAKRHTNDYLVLLGGKISAEIRAGIEQTPRIYATGFLSEEELSIWLQIADVYFATYDDGVSSRRSSAMVALEHGLPIVVNRGRNTDPVWERSPVILTDGTKHNFVERVSQLLSDDVLRARTAVNVHDFFEKMFSHHVMSERIFDDEL